MPFRLTTSPSPTPKQIIQRNHVVDDICIFSFCEAERSHHRNLNRVGLIVLRALFKSSNFPPDIVIVLRSYCKDTLRKLHFAQIVRP